MARTKVTQVIFRTLPKDLKWWIKLYNLGISRDLREKARDASGSHASASTSASASASAPASGSSGKASAPASGSRGKASAPASGSRGKASASVSGSGSSAWDQILPAALARAAALADGYEPGDFFETPISTQSSLRVPLRKKARVRNAWERPSLPRRAPERLASRRCRLVCRAWRDALPFRLEPPGSHPAIRKGPSQVHGDGVFAERDIEGGQVVARWRGTVHAALASSAKKRPKKLANIPEEIAGAPHAVAMRPFEFTARYPDGGVVRHEADAVLRPPLDGSVAIAFLNHACERHANCYIAQTGDAYLCASQLDPVHVHGRRGIDEHVREGLRLAAGGMATTAWCVAKERGVPKDTELLAYYGDGSQFACKLCGPGGRG